MTRWLLALTQLLPANSLFPARRGSSRAFLASVSLSSVTEERQPQPRRTHPVQRDEEGKRALTTCTPQPPFSRKLEPLSGFLTTCPCPAPRQVCAGCKGANSNSVALGDPAVSGRDVGWSSWLLPTPSLS